MIYTVYIRHASWPKNKPSRPYQITSRSAAGASRLALNSLVKLGLGSGTFRDLDFFVTRVLRAVPGQMAP